MVQLHSQHLEGRVLNNLMKLTTNTQTYVCYITFRSMHPGALEMMDINLIISAELFVTN